jgi:hypothetical protein
MSINPSKTISPNDQGFIVKINPRWKNAQFEKRYLIKNPGNTVILSGVVNLKTGEIIDPYPARYETAKDGLEGKNRVPMFLKVFPDGREEESF